MKVSINSVTVDSASILVSFDLVDGDKVVKSWNNIRLDRPTMNNAEKMINWCKLQAKMYGEYYQSLKDQKAIDINELSKQVVGEYLI